MEKEEFWSMHIFRAQLSFVWSVIVYLIWYNICVHDITMEYPLVML